MKRAKSKRSPTKSKKAPSVEEFYETICPLTPLQKRAVLVAMRMMKKRSQAK